MKISIITAVLNGERTLRDCLQSVADQCYPDIEHVFIDGGSTDGTVDVIRRHDNGTSRWISEPDNGLYDAMNKGIRLSTGEIVGILNSDDFYADPGIIDRVVARMSVSRADTCYGDLVYIKRDDPQTHVRYWRSGLYNRNRFRRGWMPPHPTFFVRRSVYEKYGLFNLAFPLCADYELMLRLLYRHEVSTVYIPSVMVKMRTGGSCRPGLRNTLHNMAENYRAWTVNGLKPNPLTFLLKPLRKTVQFLPSAS